MNYKILIWAILALGACKVNNENEDKNAPFELKQVISGEYETLQLAEGVEAEVLDSAEWPYAMAVWKKGLMVSSYPHALIGNPEKSKATKPYSLKTLMTDIPLSADVLRSTEGYQSGIFPSPWGGMLVAAMPFKEGDLFAGGNIWWVNDSGAVKLDALGVSSFVSVFALLTPEGRAVIYYTDQGVHEGYLYKFVADQGTDFRKGKVFVCDFHAGNWIPLDVEFNAVLKEKYNNNQKLLSRLNEAVHFSGVHMVDPFSHLQMDPLNGNILISAMPQKEKDRMFGGIYQIAEVGGKYDGAYFKASSFIFAGLHFNFTHVSQFLTDFNHNIWVVSGIPSYDIGSPEYKAFGGNALIVMPRKGPQSRLMLRVAVAPGKDRFSGLLLDTKKKHLYTFLVSVDGRSKLLRLKGKGIEGLLK